MGKCRKRKIMGMNVNLYLSYQIIKILIEIVEEKGYVFEKGFKERIENTFLKQEEIMFKWLKKKFKKIFIIERRKTMEDLRAERQRERETMDKIIKNTKGNWKKLIT